MFFALSKIVALLLKPLMWVFILVVAAFFLRKKKPALSRRVLLVSFLVLLVFSNPIVLRGAYRAWEIAPVPPASITESMEIGILLGGYSDSEQSSPEKLVLGSDPNRISEAIRLYKTGRIKKLVLTGGTGAFFSKGVSEAPLVRAFLIDLGIPAEAIIVEEKSRNTHENAVFTAALLSAEEKAAPSLLITSAFHMRRARACFEKAGIAVQPYATDSRAAGDNFVDFRSLLPDAWMFAQWEFLLREWVGILAYKITGRV